MKRSIVKKIDLEKAYDRLEWSFVEETLLDVGLPECMVGVIMSCISSAAFRLMWNGESTKIIQQTRGPRQGDPISPYIFVLCLERLAHRIQHEVETGRWKPLRASRHGPNISHLFFADDMLLFAYSSIGQMDVIKGCLDDFARASGQRINFQKSSIFFSPNLSLEAATEINRGVGIPMTDNLGKYLGMKLAHGRHSGLLYSDLLEKITKKMDGWKAKCLSLAGRVTLLHQ